MNATLKVLHFDNEPFCNSLKAHLLRRFAGLQFEFESHVIAGRDDFDKLVTRIDAMKDPTRAVDVVLLDLRLDSQPSLAYYMSDDPNVFEGIQILKMISHIDPSATLIRRAFLTGTPNYEAAKRLNCDFKGYHVDMLSKELTPTPGFQTIEKGFPENVVEYLRDVANSTGKWS